MVFKIRDMTSTDVTNAIEAVKAMLAKNPNSFSKSQRSKKFSIPYKGKHYPPKIICWAAYITAGERMTSITTDVAYRKLTPLGFKFIKRRSDVF